VSNIVVQIARKRYPKNGVVLAEAATTIATVGPR